MIPHAGLARSSYHQEPHDGPAWETAMNHRIDAGVVVLWPAFQAARKARVGRGGVECAAFDMVLPFLGALLAVAGFTLSFAGMMDMVPTPIPVHAAGVHANSAASLAPTGTDRDRPRVVGPPNTCADRTLPITPCQEFARAADLPLAIAAPPMTTEPSSGERPTLAILATTPPPDLRAVIFAAMARAHQASREVRESAGRAASSPADLRANLASMANAQRASRAISRQPHAAVRWSGEAHAVVVPERAERLGATGQPDP
jgi:hypothetical protein